MNPGRGIHPVQMARSLPNALESALNPQRASAAPGAFARWIVLTAILLIPAIINIHLVGDGVKFTPGRAAIAILLAPALVQLLKSSRKLLISDLFILLTSAWMIGSRIPDDGMNPSAVAAVIEMMGGYFVARAYFYGPEALLHFLRIFKVLTVGVIAIAILDEIFQQHVIEIPVSMLTALPYNPVQYRFGIARAVSTMEMAELYGTFCCVAGSIFLFLEQRTVKYLWAAFSFFGCVLALSSGPLLAFAMIFAFYVYNHLFMRQNARWKLVTLGAMCVLSIVFVTAEHPLHWIVAHMTLDPETGYFRLYVFDYVAAHVALAPLAGYGFGPIGHDGFLSTTTIDNVWLVCAARYGIPMIILFMLANVTTFVGGPMRHGQSSPREMFMRNAATGFTQILMTFALIGITVHFWNAAWMLWALCIGIRASLKEWLVREEFRHVVTSPPGAHLGGRVHSLRFTAGSHQSR